MAAVDYFLKLAGIDGESHDAQHKDEIDVENWSWVESQSGTGHSGGGHGAGKVVMQDFHFVMRLNKASPKLMLACATGDHIPSAVLTMRKAGGKQQEYAQFTLTDVLVSSFEVKGSSDASRLPENQITLNFAKVEWQYREQKQDGSLGAAVKVGYDAKANRTV